MKLKLIVSGILVLIALVLTAISFKVVTVEGNQLGVLETWTGGVSTNIMQPKTYFLCPGWSQSVYVYDASSRVYVMNDKPMAQEAKSANGREQDAYLVQSQEGQDMKISMNLRWRLDPEKLVSIHKTVREDIEEKLIRPTVLRVVKDEATQMKAIDAYSGEGLVKLQANIQKALAGNDLEEGEGKQLRDRGVIVENFVIEHIALDPKYVEEIVRKQIAVQSQLRAVEEQKANEADALVAKSKAQADLNTQVVAGQRDAQLVIIKSMAAASNVVIAAEAEAQQVTIAAKAAASQVTIAAEATKTQAELQGQGKKLGMTAEAEGILAMGRAKATAQELLVASYKEAGADAYAKIQIAQSLAEGTKGIQGYLPNNFNPTILAGNFMDSITAILGGHAPAK